MYTFNARLLQATCSWQALTNKGTELNYPLQLTSVKNTVQIMQTVVSSTYKMNVEFLLYCRTAELPHKMEASVVLLVVTHNKQLTEQSTGLLHTPILVQFLHICGTLSSQEPWASWFQTIPSHDTSFKIHFDISIHTQVFQTIPIKIPNVLRISDLPNKKEQLHAAESFPSSQQSLCYSQYSVF
jgi:hypothetical protein